MNKGKIFGIALAGVAGATILVSAVGLIGPREVMAKQTQPKQIEMSIKSKAKESPFFCNTGVYTAAQKERKEVLGVQFRGLAQEYRELSNGYAFRYPGDEKTIRAIAEWVDLERLCCPFFSFNLAVDREGGQFWLELTGREGVKQFIRSDFQRALSRLPAPTSAASSEQTMQSVKVSSPRAAESPFICNTGVYTPADRKRKEALDKNLAASGLEYRVLPDGYAFRFPEDSKSFEKVAEWVAMERACCPFFTINMELEGEGGSLWVRLTGREGVKQFIKADFQPLLKRLPPLAGADSASSAK